MGVSPLTALKYVKNTPAHCSLRVPFQRSSHDKYVVPSESTWHLRSGRCRKHCGRQLKKHEGHGLHWVVARGPLRLPRITEFGWASRKSILGAFSVTDTRQLIAPLKETNWKAQGKHSHWETRPTQTLAHKLLFHLVYFRKALPFVSSFPKFNKHFSNRKGGL